MIRQASLLQRAAAYTLGAVDAVTPEMLHRATPCSKWDLAMLLCHVSDSVAALEEGFDSHRVALFSPEDAERGDPTAVARIRILHLLDHRFAARDDASVAVADHRVSSAVFARAAALEIAVHGWDVYQASGRHQRIPTELATDLLAMLPVLVPAGCRQNLFASPIDIPAHPTDPGVQLLAFLGRRSPELQPLSTEAYRP